MIPYRTVLINNIKETIGLLINLFTLFIFDSWVSDNLYYHTERKVLWKLSETKFEDYIITKINLSLVEDDDRDFWLFLHHSNSYTIRYYDDKMLLVTDTRSTYKVTIDKNTITRNHAKYTNLLITHVYFFFRMLRNKKFDIDEQNQNR